jgi:hypothetical protein
MRSLALFLFLTAISASLLVAQEREHRWALGFGLTRDAFAGGSSDTTTIPGTSVEVTPAPRLAFEGRVTRRLGAWEIGVALGYSAGGLRAKTDELLLDDRTGDVKRYRAGLLVSRRLARLGTASLRLAAGPALDHWSTPGVGDRTGVSARVGLSLRIPIGALALENAASFGLGSSPFQRRNLPPEARTRSLRTWSIGGGLVLAL